MKKKLILISAFILSLNAYSETTGKYDKVEKETLEQYLERKSKLEKQISGKFTGGNTGSKGGTMTFSQAHIECTKLMVSSDTNTTNTTNQFTVDYYNSCMADYYPFLDALEGVGSCSSQSKLEWGNDIEGVEKCYADVSDLLNGESVMLQNENLNSGKVLQGFAQISCVEGVLEIINSKCQRIADPCLAGDTVGDPDFLSSKYKDNPNYIESHTWPITEPAWARPNAKEYILPSDPRGIDRSKEFANKVQAGSRDQYCRSTLSNAAGKNGETGVSFPLTTGDLIINPKLDNSPDFFDSKTSRSVWRCFDGSFYNESSNCQYKTQSCEATTHTVDNGKGKSCTFNLPYQKHNSLFTARNPEPTNSVGHVKAFCWDGNWEIWEESCQLSCSGNMPSQTWETGMLDEPEVCSHKAKSFPDRIAPSNTITIANENEKLDGFAVHKCVNGEWQFQSSSCVPKTCYNLPNNSWEVNGEICSHDMLTYNVPHNEKITTSANNNSNDTIGVISYQCRYGKFVETVDYTGEASYAPTPDAIGSIPFSKNCVESSIPQCTYDENKTQPSTDPIIFIEAEGNCYIECGINNTEGTQTCTKFCTDQPFDNPAKDCFFPTGYSSCSSSGWYKNGEELTCPQWKILPQVCNNGEWEDKNIAEKSWETKVAVAFYESLTKTEYLNNNITPTVSVTFGNLSGIYGYTNTTNKTLDKVIESGTGVTGCTMTTKSMYGITDEHYDCRTKAEQTNVQDWTLYYTLGEGCSIDKPNIQQGAFTKDNMTITCSQASNEINATPATAEVNFVIRYKDGKTLTTPKISIEAGKGYPPTAAGYCSRTHIVENIANNDVGVACNSNVTFPNAIQAEQVDDIFVKEYSYVDGVCYEVEYSGSLRCEDADPTPQNENLSLQGTLSCQSTPVAAFNCGQSDKPNWKDSQITYIRGDINTATILEIANPSTNKAYNYSALGYEITTYEQDDSSKNCNAGNESCYSKLNVVSGNPVEAWKINWDYSFNSFAAGGNKCSAINLGNNQNLSEGVWYTNNAGKIKCDFANSNDLKDKLLVTIDFKLRDGTIVRSLPITLN